MVSYRLHTGFYRLFGGQIAGNAKFGLGTCQTRFSDPDLLFQDFGSRPQKPLTWAYRRIWGFSAELGPMKNQKNRVFGVSSPRTLKEARGWKFTWKQRAMGLVDW